MDKFDEHNKIVDFFAYGTLMCEDIMEEVSGCRLSSVPGTVRGYTRRSVRGEHYPALVFDEEGYVEGVVYRNLNSSAWECLDRFEGEMYSRQVVRIEMKDGTTLPAATYVLKPQFLDYLDESEWSFEDFLRNGKEHFQGDYRGYRRLKMQHRTKRYRRRQSALNICGRVNRS